MEKGFNVMRDKITTVEKRVNSAASQLENFENKQISYENESR